MSELRVAWHDRSLVREELTSPVVDELLTEGVELSTLRALCLLAGADADPWLHALQVDRHLEWSMAGLTAVPLGNWVPVPVVTPARGRLSRFAHLRLLNGTWILESALSPWRVFLPAGPAHLDVEQSGDQAAFLSALGMLDTADDRSNNWAFHDRLFRARWRWDTPGVDTVTDDRAPAARRPERDGERIPLSVPVGPEAEEPTLWSATESRRTIREFSTDAVSLTALSTLLWRVLRITDQHDATDALGRPYQALKRPVPASGSLHSIDTWLLTRDVEGLAAAWWWYDPHSHALVRVADPTAPGEVSPADHAPVFALMTARHVRGAWKYPAWSHALELRDVGVIFHALQLTAAAVGLGVWPLGTGSDRTAGLALGIDLESDAPVGEFALGVDPREGNRIPS